ncbi:ATP-dependent helicase BRM [Olea europaea subsp. europaea]|uniref:ATP-dependent helicase BRM n=1 Tax=Olea europaea subsp. europaea TaxID=158383 RepID=A0A8S0PL82_OLEEU|nr:ATP-dependent helicase BRM [Olea europaea subsp. europaea]
MPMASPSASSQKFGSLSALDGRSSSRSKKVVDELEEGEIVGSGDSQVDHQQSGSWNQDRDEGEDEQVLQPKIKRKRSFRGRPRNAAETSEEIYGEKSSLPIGDNSRLPFSVERDLQARDDRENKVLGEPSLLMHGKIDSSFKNRQILSTRKISNTAKGHASLKSAKASHVSIPPDAASEQPSRNWDGKVIRGATTGSSKMSEVMQRKCKNVISKLQRRIDKEGHQIIPLLTELWKKIEDSGSVSRAGDSLLDLRKIDLCIDKSQYSGVMELVSDVQLMLKHGMQYYAFSFEVRTEARKVHDLFFDILKIAFPDTDFREARNSISFSSPVAMPVSGSSSRQVHAGKSKRQKSVKDVDSDPGPRQKSHARIPVHTVESTKVKSYMSQKESRLGSSSSREIGQKDEPRPLTHPGDLVICKKKRKEREKLAVKSGNELTGSPTGITRNLRSPGSSSGAREVLWSQQSTQPQGRAAISPQQENSGGGGDGSVGWANPVKRTRTGAGRRPSSHL